MEQPTLSTAAQATIHAIATDILDLPTLKARMSDRLDFHELAVWEIQTALEAAYLAGMADAGHRAST